MGLDPKDLGGVIFSGYTGLANAASNWYESRANQARDARNRADAQAQDMLNYNRQKEFAQNSIKWKVNDAKMAGLHPLYALGGAGSTFSPSSTMVGGNDSPDKTAGMFKDMADMGQDASRAFAATQTQEDREMSQLRLASARLDIEGQGIENQIKQAQLATMTTGQPPAPRAGQSFIEGQPNSGPGGRIVNAPMERVTSFPGRPDIEPGSKTGVGFYNTPSGALVPVPSKDTKESIEDNLIQEIAWSLRNNLMPNFNGGKSAPPGYTWSIKEQAYVPDSGDDPKNWQDTKPHSRKGKTYKINRRYDVKY